MGQTVTIKNTRKGSEVTVKASKGKYISADTLRALGLGGLADQIEKGHAPIDGLEKTKDN
jgi:hypothetical protein